MYGDTEGQSAPARKRGENMKAFRLKVILIMFCLFALIPSARSYEYAEDWSKTDTAYQAAYIAVTSVDFVQTHWMARQDWQWDGEKYKETCPLFLNDHPHQDATWLIPISMVVHTLIAMALPPSYKMVNGFDIHPRRTWQLLWIGIEMGAVVNNASLGVKVEF